MHFLCVNDVRIDLYILCSFFSWLEKSEENFILLLRLNNMAMLDVRQVRPLQRIYFTEVFSLYRGCRDSGGEREIQQTMPLMSRVQL